MVLAIVIVGVCRHAAIAVRIEPGAGSGRRSGTSDHAGHGGDRADRERGDRERGDVGADRAATEAERTQRDAGS
jgi:hypothetical protein